MDGRECQKIRACRAVRFVRPSILNKKARKLTISCMQTDVEGTLLLAIGFQTCTGMEFLGSGTTLVGKAFATTYPGWTTKRLGKRKPRTGATATSTGEMNGARLTRLISLKMMAGSAAFLSKLRGTWNFLIRHPSPGSTFDQGSPVVLARAY